MELRMKIAELRMLAELTREQLAERMGVPLQVVSRWESGEEIPSIEQIERMGKIFQVSSGYLTKNCGEHERAFWEQMSKKKDIWRLTFLNNIKSIIL